MSFFSLVIIVFFLRIMSFNSAILCYKGYGLSKEKFSVRTKFKGTITETLPSNQQHQMSGVEWLAPLWWHLSPHSPA
jgi:hypothetical protein